MHCMIYLERLRRTSDDIIHHTRRMIDLNGKYHVGLCTEHLHTYLGNLFIHLLHRYTRLHPPTC
jgi:hypothetical protein